MLQFPRLKVYLDKIIDTNFLNFYKILRVLKKIKVYSIRFVHLEETQK